MTSLARSRTAVAPDRTAAAVGSSEQMLKEIEAHGAVPGAAGKVWMIRSGTRFWADPEMT